MKNKFALCLFLITLFINTACLRIRQTSTWKNGLYNFGGITIKVFLNSIMEDHLLKAFKGILVHCRINQSDILVVNTKIIILFGYTNDSKSSECNGCIKGIWEIILTEDESTYELREDKYSSLVKSFQISGEYTFKIDSNPLVWSINDFQAKHSESSKQNDFQIEFEGVITNSKNYTKLDSQGKQYQVSISDSSPDLKTEGRTNFNLRYTVSQNKMSIGVSFTVRVLEGEFKINQVNTEIYYNKGSNARVEVVTSPEAMLTNENTDLSIVEENKYFSTECISRLFNYDMQYKLDSTPKNNQGFGIRLPPGRGLVSCVGNPENGDNYLCLYPDNSELINEAYENYTIKLEDFTADKTIKLTYSLLGDQPAVFSKGSQISLFNFQIKVIEATAAVPPTE